MRGKFLPRFLREDTRLADIDARVLRYWYNILWTIAAIAVMVVAACVALARHNTAGAWFLILFTIVEVIIAVVNTTKFFRAVDIHLSWKEATAAVDEDDEPSQ